MFTQMHILVASAALIGLAQTTRANDLATSFEFEDLTGEFTLGTAPRSALFEGGEAKSIGNPALYHSGTHAWMISPGQTGMITFETSSVVMELFFRNESSLTQSTVTLLDATGAVIDSRSGTETGWTQILFQDPAVHVAQIRVENSGSAGHLSVDDLSMTAVQGGPPLNDPLPAPVPRLGPDFALFPVASGLTAPNWGISVSVDPYTLYVSDQSGILWAIDILTGAKRTFLDVTPLLVPLGIFGPDSFDERGLLGVAFHPDFGQNGLLYTYTSQPALVRADFTSMPRGIRPDHQSVVTEWQVPAPGAPGSVVDLNSAREVVRIDQPQFNHDGGGLNFGPDGMLYISLGDGGGADDRDGQGFLGGTIVGHTLAGNGQNKNNVLGSILRIDPQGSNSANGSYGVPSDNPFVGVDGVDEIYAYGLRNPFRFSFDRLTGEMYIADVGQNHLEEVHVGFSGANFGWPLKEGSFFFDPNGHLPGFVTDIDPGVPAGLTDPLTQYDHDEGSAIIGGFVYRGQRLPELQGHYIFGDFSGPPVGEGRLFCARGRQTVELNLAGGGTPGVFVLGFGEDSFGEIYVLGNTTAFPFGTTGVVYRLTRGN